MENTTNFSASFIESHLESVHKASLVDICKPSFRTISEHVEKDCHNNSPPQNTRETANGVT